MLDKTDRPPDSMLSTTICTPPKGRSWRLSQHRDSKTSVKPPDPFHPDNLVYHIKWASICWHTWQSLNHEPLANLLVQRYGRVLCKLDSKIRIPCRKMMLHTLVERNYNVV